MRRQLQGAYTTTHEIPEIFSSRQDHSWRQEVSNRPELMAPRPRLDAPLGAQSLGRIYADLAVQIGDEALGLKAFSGLIDRLAHFRGRLL